MGVLKNTREKCTHEFIPKRVIKLNVWQHKIGQIWMSKNGDMRRFKLNNGSSGSYLKIAKTPKNVCISQHSSWICIKMNENPIRWRRWCGSFCLHDAGEYQLAYYWVSFCVHQPRKLKTSQFRNVTKGMNEWRNGTKKGRKQMKMKSQTKHYSIYCICYFFSSSKLLPCNSISTKSNFSLWISKRNGERNGLQDRMQFEFGTIFFQIECCALCILCYWIVNSFEWFTEAFWLISSSFLKHWNA